MTPARVSPRSATKKASASAGKATKKTTAAPKKAEGGVKKVAKKRRPLSPEARAKLAAACACLSSCTVHGHDHARALGSQVPARDVQSFWGALGCGCWAV